MQLIDYSQEELDNYSRGSACGDLRISALHCTSSSHPISCIDSLYGVVELFCSAPVKKSLFHAEAYLARTTVGSAAQRSFSDHKIVLGDTPFEVKCNPAFCLHILQYPVLLALSAMEREYRTGREASSSYQGSPDRRIPRTNRGHGNGQYGSSVCLHDAE